jgi:F-type H+-transporting ATPase subunit delta
VSTSEAQVIARALYDSLIGSSLQSLRVAAERLNSGGGESVEQRVKAALPADAPRAVQNLLLALARDGALNQLPNVVAAFERYARQHGEESLSGEVTSAVELDAAQRERITAQLRERYGNGLTLQFQVDPSIIGGLIIRIGDQVLDNSLRTRLSAIQRNMLSS